MVAEGTVEGLSHGGVAVVLGKVPDASRRSDHEQGNGHEQLEHPKEGEGPIPQISLLSFTEVRVVDTIIIHIGIP